MKVKVMADDVGQQRRGRGVRRRPGGHRGGRGQGHPQRGGRQGQRQGRVEENGAEDDVVQVAEPVAPPRQVPRRRVHIGAAALDRMTQLEPEELLLQITNRVSEILSRK